MKKSHYLIHLLLLVQLFLMFSLYADDNMTIEITSPRQKIRYRACDDIVIETTATIQTGEINRVYFYANGKAIGTARAEPYQLVWENVPTGIYEITAKVRDKDRNDAFSDPVLVFVDPVEDNDIIINGEFSCRKWPWVLNVYESAKATFEIDPEGGLSDSSSAVIDIEFGDTMNWHIQFVQYVKLDSGHTYEISYMMDAFNESNILTSLHLDVDPYTTYWSNQFQLTEFTELDPMTYECAINDPRARLTFQIGTNEGPIFIDAMKIIDLNWEDSHFTAVDENTGPAKEYNLSQNYPNPFNPQTYISYTIPNSEHVNITIYNVLGKAIKTLVNGKRAAGIHTVKWNGADNYGHSVSSGVYFYKMVANNYIESNKMYLMR